MGEPGKDRMKLNERTLSGSSGMLSPTRESQDEFMEQCPSKSPFVWTRIRHKYQDAFSEFFGTFIFLLFSFGVTAQVTLSKGKNGDYTALCLGWGVGIMLGAYTAARSGGHLNPCVTLTLVVFRKFPLRKFLVYALAQTLGAFAAAAVVYANYRSAIDAYEGHGVRTVPGTRSNHSTAGIFATYPADFMTTTGAFFSEFVASAVLMFCIFVLQCPRTGAQQLTPLVLGFVFIGISACLGWESGFAINFARDFGPRCFVAMAGYGRDVWTSHDYYFWVPMVAPFLGCIFGGWLFDAFLNDSIESPLNSSWMGFGQLMWNRKVVGQSPNSV